jgi:hypothetical protein
MSAAPAFALGRQLAAATEDPRIAAHIYLEGIGAIDRTAWPHRRRPVLHRRRPVRALAPPRLCRRLSPGPAEGFSPGLADQHFVTKGSR